MSVCSESVVGDLFFRMGLVTDYIRRSGDARATLLGLKDEMVKHFNYENTESSQSIALTDKEKKLYDSIGSGKVEFVSVVGLDEPVDFGNHGAEIFYPVIRLKADDVLWEFYSESLVYYPNEGFELEGISARCVDDNYKLCDVDFSDSGSDVFFGLWSNLFSQCIIDADAYLVENPLEYSEWLKLFDCLEIKSSPLHCAAETGSTELVDFMLSRGFDVDNQGSDGVTALMQAVSRSMVCTVEQLLSYGADASKKDNEGYSAVDYILDDCELTTKSQISSLIESSILKVASESRRREAPTPGL